MNRNPCLFPEFLKHHETALRRFVRRFVRSDEDAEDIAQEAMLRAFRTRSQAGVAAAGRLPVESQARLGGWLYTIARNLSIDHLRRKRERAATDAELAQAPSKAPTPEVLYERRLAVERLRGALNVLPRHYREILELRFTDGLSYRRIAEHLAVPLTTVETRLHRARRMLRRILGDGLDE